MSRAGSRLGGRHPSIIWEELTLQGRARLRLDAQTGLVREVWVQELAVNEQPLLPEQLIKWVRLGSEGLSPDVATILRSLTPWLES